MLVKANANNAPINESGIETIPQTGEQNYHKVLPLLGILKHCS
jgi:hypothetical protein